MTLPVVNQTDRGTTHTEPLCDLSLSCYAFERGDLANLVAIKLSADRCS